MADTIEPNHRWSAAEHAFAAAFNTLLNRTNRLLVKADTLLTRTERIMATAQEILDKVTAQTGVLQSVAVAVDELNGEQATIAEEIARLKKIIEDLGTPVDLTALETAVNEQGAVIDGLKAAISANPGPTP